MNPISAPQPANAPVPHRNHTITPRQITVKINREFLFFLTKLKIAVHLFSHKVPIVDVKAVKHQRLLITAQEKTPVEMFPHAKKPPPKPTPSPPAGQPHSNENVIIH